MATCKREDYEVSLPSCWASSSVISTTLPSALTWANEESQDPHSGLLHLLRDCLSPTKPSIACASPCDHCIIMTKSLAVWKKTSHPLLVNTFLLDLRGQWVTEVSSNKCNCFANYHPLFHLLVTY